ncbi:torsin-1A-interacting protein 2-like isoform X4 [Heptranchias perlo]|uniref:torsin-1A-interacting protein 2-like isoform X4 n=1 Tax=Heptranchias perlo TaxID=212740 RepID=UPI00355A02E8
MERQQEESTSEKQRFDEKLIEKVNVPQDTEDGTQSQPEEENQESTSEQQRLDEKLIRKAHVPQYTEDGTQSQPEEENQDLMPAVGVSQASGNPAAEGRREWLEPTESTCEKQRFDEKLMGEVNVPQDTKDGTQSQPEEENQESTSEKQRFDEKLMGKVNVPQYTEDGKQSQPEEENQESTSEKQRFDEKLMGKVHVPQYTEDGKQSQPEEENQESTCEKQRFDEKLMGEVNVPQDTKDGTQSQPEEENQESTSEKQRFDEKLMGKVHVPQYTEDGMQSQPEEENQESTSEKQRIDEKLMGKVHVPQCTEDGTQSQPKEENQESTSEQQRLDEKPIGKVHVPQYTEDRKQSQPEDENQESTSEKQRFDEKLMGKVHVPQSQPEEENQETTSEKQRLDEKLMGKVHVPQYTEDRKQSQPEDENQEHTSEKQIDEKPMGNVQESQITKGLNQPEQGKNGKWSVGFASMGVLLVSLFAYFMLNYHSHQESEIVEKTLNIFLQNFGKVQKSFPNQEEQLWKRSRIMLRKHINVTMHSEPSILMFAAARDAEETMRCLTNSIAGAYALAFNSTIVEIDGSGKMLFNSDEVKLDLDNQMSSRFSEGRKSAVIHHFQDLPPPSTLLFYKYCDHENAAFKDVSLLITVLLDDQKLDPDLSFDLLEEIVYDFLVMKFSISGKTGQYNILDIDKFSGLWSRIAHAILLVRPEKEIEENGCKHE